MKPLNIKFNTHHLNRAGLATCTYTMLEVLHRLNESRLNDMPFMPVDDVNKHTLRALVKRDWIVISPGKKLDVTRAKITTRGQRAYKIYSDPDYDTRRFDGICPTCETRPRHRHESGRLEGYCLPCLQKYESRRGHRNRRRPDGKCPDCGKPRYVSPSGHVATYCRSCRNAKHRAHKRKQQQELRQRIEAGDVLLCQRCGERPRHVTPATVRDWCYECYTSYMNDYNHRRRYDQQECETA